MALDKSLVEKFRKVTTKAAYAASKFKGLNDKNGADNAAVEVMRAELNKIDMFGRVVIGEGELDEAPMLFIGEKLGTMSGPELDIAVDPLEGTNFAAYNLPGALSVQALRHPLQQVVRWGGAIRQPDDSEEAAGSAGPAGSVEADRV